MGDNVEYVMVVSVGAQPFAEMVALAEQNGRT